MKTRVVEIIVTGAGKDYDAAVRRMMKKTREFNRAAKGEPIVKIRRQHRDESIPYDE